MCVKVGRKDQLGQPCSSLGEQDGRHRDGSSRPFILEFNALVRLCSLLKGHLGAVIQREYFINPRSRTDRNPLSLVKLVALGRKR